MTAHAVRLTDATGRLLAVARVTDEGKYLGGTADLTATPPEVRALFEEFEELVNDQCFSLADEVEAKVDALGVRAVFDGGEMAVSDLQVYPSTGAISFRSPVPAAPPGSPHAANGAAAPAVTAK